MRIKVSIITIFLSCIYLNAQEIKADKKGSAIITIFSDFHSGFGNVNNERGFGLERAYIGYQYKLSSNIKVKAIADFGQSEDVKDMNRIGFIKNAMIEWEYGKLSLKGGLIGTTQFKHQESFWGKRYLMKSFQDEYKFGSSADLGLSCEYKWNNFIYTDVIIANGEGYKKLQIGKGLQYGLGMTINPYKDLTLRLYASYNEYDNTEVQEKNNYKGTTNIAGFIGYKHKYFTLGSEYNFMKNTDFQYNRNKMGLSVYTTVILKENINIFGRYDYLYSNKDWDIENDLMTGLFGIEYKINRYIKISPNIRMIHEINKRGINPYLYLNLGFDIKQ